MAIRTDEDVWNETETGPGARERIVDFLGQNRGKAFSAMEIHDHAFDTPTPDPDDDPSSYSAIITQMTIHLSALSYLGKVEGKPLPNDELPNDSEGGHKAYYTATEGDGDGGDGEGNED
ncbi:hypothetical protein EGH25_02090 [Haladaptatus sp. F3-133]|jgi:hypothetical protein|uniref:Uncharacterized protein n=1 Tax=Halorutilus salinus TaxID=2487751 RepID=A0A9Q4C1E5_9EURY|nr:hypothetical protein [Halorutilus salinus]MCX2818145.1 hypothetical protein [Halorutilus salinus]